MERGHLNLLQIALKEGVLRVDNCVETMSDALEERTRVILNRLFAVVNFEKLFFQFLQLLLQHLF